MLSWLDFDIMSFGCSYSMNMYLCIIGLAFFYSWAVFGTGYHYFLLNGEHTVTEDWLSYYIGDTACMHACMHNNSFSMRLASQISSKSFKFSV